LPDQSSSKNLTKSVLITGGSGLLGSALTDSLLQKGYQVSHIGRRASTGKVNCFRWSVKEKYFDPAALEGVDIIIHLAGAGVSEKRWTKSHKKEILESRTFTSQLLFDSLKNIPNNVRTVICATAIGYYGLTTQDTWCKEDQAPGDDFLASVTKAWEESILPIANLGKRLVMTRIGVVLANEGGALMEMANPVRWFVGAPLGNGKQWVSWIHLSDVSRLYQLIIEDENISGIYNAVAPNPVTNRELTRFIARALHRPLLLPPIPDFVLQIVLGDMAEIVVNGARVSCEKIESVGFQFEFTDASVAVHNLLDRLKVNH
jgi:uncharacterized protein (TIGR01777 family)